MRRFANGFALALVAVLGLSSFAAASATSSAKAATADCASVGVGASGPAVRTLQQAVRATPDGDFGPQTSKAVAAWQHKHKVKPTGVVDAATWKALPKPVALAACGQQARGTGVLPTCTTLHLGARGPAVAVLQRALRLTADGDFGPHTRAGLLAAQTRLKVPATGMADAATWAALGRTGTPACVTGVVAVTAAASTPAPAPTTSPTTSPTPTPTATPTPKPTLPADWPAQQKVRAQVGALAAALPTTPGTTTDQLAAKALTFAQSQTGKPYKWGGVGPSSYDCSGLVQTSYRNSGVTLPRVAADQYGVGQSVPLDQVQQGDLLFYAMDVTQPATIYHVVMYAGAGKIVDAPYTGAYVGTRPLWTKDLLPVAWRPTGALVLPVNPGATGWTVAQVQQALDRGGAKLTVDGGYGPATTAAVKSWQSAHKLSPTGVVDVATWLTFD